MAEQASGRGGKVYLLLITTMIPYLIEGMSDVIGVFSTRERAEEVGQKLIRERQEDPFYRQGQVSPLIYELEIDQEYDTFNTAADFPGG